MYLAENTVFDNRYRLVSLLGRGASAQVWLAEDTLTGNLRVAIKIFSSAEGELDSYGRQDFQKEFTTVYNINHQNLLTPTNYSVVDGLPYLVLPYCENGSVSSMVGRCEQTDIVKLIHDVAAGLEFLHLHNVVHQDIKPDNIMLDDDLNYLVSDFGISTGRDADTENFGGTRAYMAPERFSGVSDAKTDVWALGATAYEMITGNAPYGDHGGLAQTPGEPVPPLDKPGFDSELEKLIDSMLDPDPARRPTPAEIRRLTERYLETGSWKEKPTPNTVKIGGIVLALIVIAAGIFAWGMLRTKTYYYRDYVEVNGAPVGIGSLYGSEKRDRAQSYRIQTKGGKVVRVSLVNAKGKVIPYADAENLGLRFPDQEYHYGSNGRVDYMIARNEHGKVLYKFTYGDKGNIVTITYDDDKNSPKFFNGTGNPSTDDIVVSMQSSNIAHMYLKYDPDGRLVERTYLSLPKEPTADLNGIFGEQYEYDNLGRVISVTAIDRDGNPVGDENGTAIRRYKYDDEGNRTEVAFFAHEGSPSHEGHNIHRAALSYDEVGNLISEMYFNGNDDPVPSSKSRAFGYKYTYDDGYRTTATAVDADGNPMFINDGYVTVRYTPDGNNFDSRVELLDDEGNHVIGTYNSLHFAVMECDMNPIGLATEIRYLDENGNLVDDDNYIAQIEMEYNDEGDVTERRNFGIDGKPVANGGYETSYKREYDELGRPVKESYFDIEGNPTRDQSGVYAVELAYSPYGSVAELKYYDADGKPMNNNSGFANVQYQYDSTGRLQSVEFKNASGNLTSSGDYARLTQTYDAKTSRLSKTDYYNSSNGLIFTDHYTYDPLTGHIATQWRTGSNGSLYNGSSKRHYRYNELGMLVSESLTDLSDNPVNGILNDGTNGRPVINAHEIRYEYDSNGNNTAVSIWNSGGQPGSIADGTHVSRYTFDQRGRRTSEINLTAGGSPIKSSATDEPEVRYKYDNRNNTIEVAIFDGHGNPATGNSGFHRIAKEYDSHNRQVSEIYYDTAGNQVAAGNAQSSKCTVEYDERGNITSMRYYAPDGKLRFENVRTYNDHNSVTSERILNAQGKPDDSIYGQSIAEFTYEADGITPRSVKFYNASHTLLSTMNWNKETRSWGQNQAAAQDSSAAGNKGKAGSSASSGGNASWQQAVRKQNETCPREIMEGMVMRKITCTDNSVTIVIVMKNITGNNYDRDEINDLGNDYRAFPHNYLGVPANIACHVQILNRNNSVIYSR